MEYVDYVLPVAVVLGSLFQGWIVVSVATRSPQRKWNNDKMMEVLLKVNELMIEAEDILDVLGIKNNKHMGNSSAAQRGADFEEKQREINKYIKTNEPFLRSKDIIAIEKCYKPYFSIAIRFINLSQNAKPKSNDVDEMGKESRAKVVNEYRRITGSLTRFEFFWYFLKE